MPAIVPVRVAPWDEEKDYYPGLTGIGNILARAGYRQVSLLGSDATFAGGWWFFRDHGAFEVLDLSALRKRGDIPGDYHVHWGVEDRKLFEIAKKILPDLACGDQPFNLMIRTVDTHPPGGYVDPGCVEPFPGRQYANAVACTDRLTTAFIRWLQEQDFYGDTTVVITGDHPTMEKGFVATPEGYRRKVYACYMNTAHADFADTASRTYAVFDHFPTILSAVGAQIPGHRLALGTDLFSGRPTLSEEYGYDLLDRELSKRSVFLDQKANARKDGDTGHPGPSR